ncbi:MAG: T9SS type A sorting domain-containing protein, partial [Bacteroidota bacterium]
IDLITFTARLYEDAVQLEWITAAEESNEGFEVEHSIDGRTFRAISQLSGYGTTNERHTYHVTHASPLKGVNYYRLKQIDFDGSYSYSEIETVLYEEKQKQDQVIAYPNPFRDRVHLEFQATSPASEGNTMTTLDIFDQLGKRVYRLQVPLNQQSIELNLAALPNGLYSVKSSEGELRIVKR